MVSRAAGLRLALLTTVAVAVGAATAASAHAFLEKASPRVGSQVSASPSEVRLWFSEGLEVMFSGVTILGPTGKPVSEGTVRVEGADHRQLVAPIVGALAPGQYRVRWKVVSVDSHPTQGDFTFSVGL